MRPPRGTFERLNTLLSARIWKTADRSDSPIAATCRNLSGRGCRFVIEDLRWVSEFYLESPIYFSFQLKPDTPEISGGGVVNWLKKQRGEPDKIRYVLGVEFTSVSFADRDRIRAFIFLRHPPGV